MYTHISSLLSLPPTPPQLSLEFQTHLLSSPTPNPRESHAIRQTIFHSAWFRHEFLSPFCPSPHSGNNIHEQNSRKLKSSLHMTRSFLMRPGLCALIGVRQEGKSQEKKMTIFCLRKKGRGRNKKLTYRLLPFLFLN